MNSSTVDKNLKKAFLFLMRNLSDENQLETISELSLFIKTKKIEKKSATYFSGKWDSAKSAEEINKEIRTSRTFNHT